MRILIEYVGTSSRITMIECLVFYFGISSCASAQHWYKNAIKFSSFNARYLRYGWRFLQALLALGFFFRKEFVVCKIMMKKERCREFYRCTTSLNSYLGVLYTYLPLFVFDYPFKSPFRLPQISTSKVN